jgi:peptidoglycan/LPS O-acetylase OafA/YrhL
VRDRILRLGVPFILAASLVAPLAYYPAYAQRAANPSLAGWWQEWISLANWPAGPVWFIAVLLVFDCLATLTFAMAPHWADKVGKLTACFAHRPFALLLAFASVSAAAYIPLAQAYNPIVWTAWGPFTYQTSRILLYWVYFAIGLAVGAYGTDRGILSRSGALARRWWAWVIAAVLAFVTAAAGAIVSSSTGPVAIPLLVFRDFGYALSCAASSLALLALFLRFAQQRNRVFDSLQRNSYGIYLVHYAFCSWLQYLLLKAPIPALGKVFIVFAGALALSWWVASWGRRCRTE